jgi:hypothetical protein
VNEAYAAADERDVADFPGHNHFELYPNAENEAIFRSVVASRRPYRATAKPFSYAGHPERGVSYWDWMLTPLLDESGEVELLVFSLEDVTPRVLAEQELREAIVSFRLTEGE